MASFSSKIWLLQGLVHSVPGQLKLQGNTLSLTVTGNGTMGRRSLSTLGNKTKIPDISERLNRQEQVHLWSVKLQDLQKVRFPLLYFSAGIHLTVNNQRYRLSFLPPQNTHLPKTANVSGLSSIGKARKIGKQWKEILQRER